MRSCLSTPPSAAKGPPARPVLARPTTRRARPSPASRLPSCAQNFLPNLTHSLVNSRVTLIHLACLSTPSNAAKMLLTSIPFETGTLPANATTVSWPSRLPLRNTKYEIRNSAPNLLLPPCKSLHHRISCTHRRKSKATANHLCTFTNVCRLTEQPQLQDHNAAAPDATRCPHRKIFSERARQHTNSRGNSRHFAPIRYSPHAPTGYRAGHHMNSCSALTRSAPVSRPPRPRPRPSPSRPSAVMHQMFLDPFSRNLP